MTIYDVKNAMEMMPAEIIGQLTFHAKLAKVKPPIFRIARVLYNKLLGDGYMEYGDHISMFEYQIWPDDELAPNKFMIHGLEEPVHFGDGYSPLGVEHNIPNITEFDVKVLDPGPSRNFLGQYNNRDDEAIADAVVADFQKQHDKLVKDNAVLRQKLAKLTMPEEGWHRGPDMYRQLTAGLMPLARRVFDYMWKEEDLRHLTGPQLRELAIKLRAAGMLKPMSRPKSPTEENQ